MRIIRSLFPPAALACGLVLLPALAGSAENPPGQQSDQQTTPTDEQKTAANAEPAAGVTEAEKTEAKAIFAAQCGWCHGSYGMTADKGPRLAGTQMTEQEVEQRIRNGKPNYMPSFKKFLNDQQIALMARYIKSLKPED